MEKKIKMKKKKEKRETRERDLKENEVKIKVGIHVEGKQNSFIYNLQTTLNSHNFTRNKPQRDLN